jgi:putative DNA primase/helicase
VFLDDRDAAETTVRDAMAVFRQAAVKPLGLLDKGQVARATDRFGLIAAAGDLATTFGFPGWHRAAAVSAALVMLGARLVEQGGRSSWAFQNQN